MLHPEYANEKIWNNLNIKVGLLAYNMPCVLYVYYFFVLKEQAFLYVRLTRQSRKVYLNHVYTCILSKSIDVLLTNVAKLVVGSKFQKSMSVRWKWTKRYLR